jgi:Sulfotransferase family
MLPIQSNKGGTVKSWAIGMTGTVRKCAPTVAAPLMMMCGALLLLLVSITQMRKLEVDILARNTILSLVEDKKIDRGQEEYVRVKFEEEKSWPSGYRKIPKRTLNIVNDIVQPGDYIYYNDIDSWDSAPIVVESHKLIFFTIPKVGCTVWKQLFRRMMGYADWTAQESETFLPHNSAVNGLKYLYNYSLEEASIMMTSPEWTRAMMVRDPKQRFLSAFLDKSVGNFHLHIQRRCCPDESCIEGAQTVEGFLQLCAKCYDDHWRPQNNRVDYKYWPFIDHVGQVETAAADAKVLLQRIGAWDEFGAAGWGDNGRYSIFGSKHSGGTGMNHSTSAEWQIWKWYTPESEKLVERYYQGDYENPLFQFSQGGCLTCIN